jgi:hypothetical protein
MIGKHVGRREAGEVHRDVLGSHEGDLDCELWDTCPALKDLARSQIMIKECNNKELALKMGLMRKGGWKCPCWERITSF